MTERQELRAKSLELAIGLMKVAVGTLHSVPKEMTKEQSQVFVDCAVAFAEHFEVFILKAPDPQNG